jgi:hypothetical protein
LGWENLIRNFHTLAWFDEKVASPSTLAQAGQYEYLGEFPLIVIATARPAFIEDRGQILHDLWLELQQELTLLSENSEIRIYAVGHYPQLQNPELVIDAIRDVLRKCEEN